MQGVTVKSRAAAFAAGAGAVVFILSLLLGDDDGDVLSIGRSLIIAILCGTMSWASAQRTTATTHRH